MISITTIQDKARLMRQDIVKMAYEGKTSHVGSALSCTDILAVLYLHVMNITISNWQTVAADRFILSKGHGVKAWYAALHQANFIDERYLTTYAKDGSHLGEHPSPGSLPGILVGSGSLGHGISIAAGMAMAKKMDHHAGRMYVLMSDGECNEGSVWEAAMAIVHQKLDNVTVIIDDNGWQAMGRSRQVSGLDPLASKWESFGWKVYEADGHDAVSLMTVLDTAKRSTGKPNVVIAKTCLGKGVSFMEDDLLWHYQIPSHEQMTIALKELGAS